MKWLKSWGRRCRSASTFRDQLNLLNCNTYNAKTFFLQFQASHFGIRYQSTNHALPNPPFGHFLIISWWIFKKQKIKTLTVGTPSLSSGRQNGTQNRPSGVKNRIKYYPAFLATLKTHWFVYRTLLIPLGSLLQDVQWLFASSFCKYLAKKCLPQNCQHPKV